MSQDKNKSNPPAKKQKNSPEKIPQNIERAVRQEVSQAVHAQIQRVNSPLPPPDMLQQYDLLMPGSAQQIMRMAQAEQDIEHEIVRRQATFTEKEAAREFSLKLTGLLSGLFIAVFGLALSGFLIYSGKTVSGTIIGTADLAIIVGLFLRANPKIQETKTAPEKNE